MGLHLRFIHNTPFVVAFPQREALNNTGKMTEHIVHSYKTFKDVYTT